jgi:hypothetical protein
MLRIAPARAAASPAGTSRPVSPSATISGRPPTLLATTGNPTAMASMAAIPRPSCNDGRTKTSAPGSRCSTAVEKPQNTTFSASPCCRAASSSCVRSVPLPQITQRSGSPSATRSANAPSITRCPLRGSSTAAVKRTISSGAMPQLWRVASRCLTARAKRSQSMPRWMTRKRRASTPASTSTLAIASEMAMTPSTLRL